MGGVMANISDIIENFILKTLGDDQYIDISRNELANFFSCANSQINYVLDTRFTMDKGFMKESHRGGGGYIRIIKVDLVNDDVVGNLVLESIGDELTEKRLGQILDRLTREKIITEKEKGLLSSGLSDEAMSMPFSIKDKIRASQFKHILMFILKDKESK